MLQYLICNVTVLKGRGAVMFLRNPGLLETYQKLSGQYVPQKQQINLCPCPNLGITGIYLKHLWYVKHSRSSSAPYTKPVGC